MAIEEEEEVTCSPLLCSIVLIRTQIEMLHTALLLLRDVVVSAFSSTNKDLSVFVVYIRKLEAIFGLTSFTYNI